MVDYVKLNNDQILQLGGDAELFKGVSGHDVIDLKQVLDYESFPAGVRDTGEYYPIPL